MKLRVLTLCVLAALAACHRDSGTAPKVTAIRHVRAPVTPQAEASAQELTAGMVEAATQGKSQAPVTLKFDLEQRPVQGQPLEIDLALLPRIAASPATINVTASDGLQVGASDSQIEFPAVDAAQVYRRSIKLTPTGEGVLLLTLSVSLKHDQMADSRVFSVPIIVTVKPGATPAQQPATATHAPAADPAETVAAR
jgi:hypothetical protein